MHLQTAEMNRFARDLYRRALEIRFQAEDGDDVCHEARQLNTEAATAKPVALSNLTPVATRVKYLQTHSFNNTGANAHTYLQSLGPHGFKAALPGIINRANAGDKEALAFAGAAIGILDNMPGAQRPLTSKKLARIIDMPDFDTDHPNASEAVNLINATEMLCGVIADGKNLSTRDKIKLGQMLNDVRHADELSDENEAIFVSSEEPDNAPDPEKESQYEPTDTTEPDQTSDNDGQDSSGETANNDTDAGAESEDPSAENPDGSGDTKGGE